MGNILIDLDQTFSKFHFTYLKHYGNGFYELAADVLYEANACLPTEASVTDLAQFELKKNTLKFEIGSDATAREYCRHWAPLVWRSIADYRQDMLDRLGD